MNENRRKFLKVMFVGGGAFLAGKVLGPLFSFFSEDQSNPNTKVKNNLKKTTLGNFLITEDKKKLSIRDSSGVEIFQIDNEA